MAHSAAFSRWVDEVNRSGGTYHRMDFGDGLVMDGEYDMASYLEHYAIPDDLQGKRVLDVGTASGFFAVECARRGAEVTAIDLHDGGMLSRIAEGLELDRIRYVQKSVFDLDPGFGQFDLVVCGSVLLHLRDIVGAIQALRKVCCGTAIISTGVLRRASGPVCEFVGERAMGDAGEYWTYWMPSVEALLRMTSASGFDRVEEISRFTLRSVPGKSDFATPHGVVRGVVDD